MGIFLGILAAVSWGVTDIFIALLTRLIGTTRALLLTQTGCLVATIIVACVTWSRYGSGYPRIWELIAVCGICHVAGMLFMYRAFEIGTLSLVSPIGSGFAIVTALLAAITGEHLANRELIGAGLLVAGVIMATRSSPSGIGKVSFAGVPEAFGSALAFGTMFWLMEYIVPSTGPFKVLVVLRFMALSGAAALFAAQRNKTVETVPVLNARVFGLTSAVVATDMIAWIAFNFGIESRQHVTVITALTSLYSAVTVLLSWMIFKDRLNRGQWIGVSAIFLGIVLVSFHFN